jgi:ribosome maturation factor RimP
VLQITIENTDETPISIDDCVRASKEISVLLDIEDPIEHSYTLEVSSPGLDRPLMKLRDYERFSGHLIKLQTSVPIAGRKRFKGQLLKVRGELVVINSEGEQFEIPHANIRQARLVPELETPSTKGTKKHSKAKQ